MPIPNRPKSGPHWISSTLAPFRTTRPVTAPEKVSKRQTPTPIKSLDSDDQRTDALHVDKIPPKLDKNSKSAPNLIPNHEVSQRDLAILANEENENSDAKLADIFHVTYKPTIGTPKMGSNDDGLAKSQTPPSTNASKTDLHPGNIDEFNPTRFDPVNEAVPEVHRPTTENSIISEVSSIFPEISMMLDSANTSLLNLNTSQTASYAKDVPTIVAPKRLPTLIRKLAQKRPWGAPNQTKLTFANTVRQVQSQPIKLEPLQSTRLQPIKLEPKIAEHKPTPLKKSMKPRRSKLRESKDDESSDDNSSLSASEDPSTRPSTVDKASTEISQTEMQEFPETPENDQDDDLEVQQELPKLNPLTRLSASQYNMFSITAGPFRGPGDAYYRFVLGGKSIRQCAKKLKTKKLSEIDRGKFDEILVDKKPSRFKNAARNDRSLTRMRDKQKEVVLKSIDRKMVSLEKTRA